MSFEDQRNSGKPDSEKGLPGEVTAGLRNERLCEESRSQQWTNIRAMKGMRTLKQKKRNRLLAALLAVAMMFQMLPLMAFADEGDGAGSTKGEVSVNNSAELKTAVQSVQADGEVTIHLGAGTYTLYEGDGPNSSLVKPGVKIHLVGEGIDTTTLEIGGPLSKPLPGHEEQGSDYSFGGADTVTFEDMTLTTRYQRHYQGFSHIKNETSVNRCKINGYTAYWGYQSATFTDTEFNPPLLQYALWTYCSPVMTFDHCTFNASGKVINVYTDYSAGSHDITVNFKDCTVNGSSIKQALNINDSNMGGFKYILNITDPQLPAERDNIARDDTTCSRVFGFGGKKKAETNNKGKTDVKINDKLVWSEGKMLTHSYTDGEKDQAYDTTYSAWRQWDERNDERDVNRKCRYCGWEENYTERASVYRLQYNLNGGTGAEGANYDNFYHEKENVTLAAAPSREGYKFVCWKDAAGTTYLDGAETVLQGDTVLTAQWGEEPPEKPAESGESGCGVVSTVLIATGATAIGYYAGTQVLKHCYGLPYWPGNRSALALMLWEDADRPMPVSTVLYPDVGQKERDMDLQHAARWAMENELIPDLNLDDSKPEEEQKFFPNYAVSRAWALHAWNKAQKLKKNA